MMVGFYKNSHACAMAAKSIDKDGFQLVKRRKHLKAPKNIAQSQALLQDQAYSGPPLQDIVRKITAYRESLQDTQFFSEIQDILKTTGVPPFREVVCYGIGQIGTSNIAQLQFALLLEIAAHHSSQQKDLTIWVFDPVLHREELAAVEQCGCHLITTNEVCKRKVRQPTLFYMPHCGKAMYNNLLWANWSIENLAQIAIIGNTFSSYHERIPTKQLEREARYIYKISSTCCEYPLPTSYPDSTVFNDLSLHVFPRERLTHLPEREWTDCPEPHLDPNDPEIIS